MKEHIERVEQKASDGHWLYKGDLAGNDVVFAKAIMRPANTEPWGECTDEEKEQWEHDHPQPESENPENENKEDGQ